MKTAILPQNSNYKEAKRGSIFHYPGFLAESKLNPANTSACELLLKKWFGSSVILTASGKSAIHLVLKAEGMNRYNNNLQIPQYLSRCIVNALTPNVFPVRPPAKADGVLFYHQYGFGQRCRPVKGLVIEDIAHAFFASPYSGKRQWVGEVAVFSLPKFFSTGGLIGGIVIRNKSLEYRIRDMIGKSTNEPQEIRYWIRRVVSGAFNSDSKNMASMFINSAYELLLEFIKPEPLDLSGFPESLEGIYKVGQERYERFNYFKKILMRKTDFPDFWPKEKGFLPFALPYFSNGSWKRLERINKALEEQKIHAGIYHLDVKRDMYHPKYRPCVLIPCHHRIRMDRFESICKTIFKNDKN